LALLLVEQHLPLNVEEEETAERRMASREMPATESLWEEDPPPCSPRLMMLIADHGDVPLHHLEEKGVDAEVETSDSPSTEPLSGSWRQGTPLCT
jgi:hypothetical protein